MFNDVFVVSYVVKQLGNAYRLNQDNALVSVRFPHCQQAVKFRCAREPQNHFFSFIRFRSSGCRYNSPCFPFSPPLGTSSPLPTSPSDHFAIPVIGVFDVTSPNAPLVPISICLAMS